MFSISLRRAKSSYELGLLSMFFILFSLKMRSMLKSDELDVWYMIAAALFEGELGC